MGMHVKIYQNISYDKKKTLLPSHVFLFRIKLHANINNWEIEVTSVTYHTKVGETIGQISPPYILLSQNVSCIFPSKIFYVIRFETNG